MKYSLLVAVVSVFLVCSSACWGQQFATVKITVTDPTGAVVPGVAITVKNTETGTKRLSITGANGLAVIADLPAGAYTVTTEAANFTTRTLPVQLSVGQTASIPIALGVSAREEKVNVTETAQGIDVEKAEVSQVIDAPRIADLPISGRDFIDFVLLTPTVNVGRSTAVGAQSPFTESVLKLSFAGTRESHTSFFALDGVDYTTSISGVQRVSPSQDWVQEFRVVDSPYTADNGRNLGSVVNTITKSGTNDVHGSIYEFFRNDALDATNKLSAPGFNTFRFNQFGGTVGGPVRKNRNFFFLGYEGQRTAESPIYSSFILNCIDKSVPNYAQVCGLPFSINDVKKSLGLQPENLKSILTRDDYDKFIGKLNNVLSDSTQLGFTYLFNDSRKQNVRTAAPGEGLPSSYRDNPVRDQTVAANLIHVFSPRMSAETLLQFGRRVFHLTPVGEGFEPALQIPNLLFGGGFVGSVSFYQEQHFQAAENITSTHGNHTFKFGAEFQPVWTSAQVPLFSPGAGLFCPDSFFGTPNIFGCGDFSSADTPFGPGTPEVFAYLIPRSLFGQPISSRNPSFQAGLYSGADAQQFTNGTSLSYTHKLISGYWQDQWRARANLSFTFGLHYDVDMMPSASDVKITAPDLKSPGVFHPTKYNNFQPRFALAYSFHDGKGVVRAGAGIFVAPFVYSDVLVSWIGASEFTYMHNPFVPQLQNPTQSLIGFGASGVVGVPGPVQASPAFHAFIANGTYPDPTQLPVLQFPLGYAQRDFNSPFSETASLEIEHQIGRDWYASIGYHYLHASRLPVYRSINGIPQPGCDPAVTSGCKPFFLPADPNFGFALMVNPIGWSIYNGGTFSLRRNFSHHYNLLANYTYSKSIDISTTVNLPNTPENYLNPAADRAVGDNDVRHRFTLAFLAESPSEWPRLLRQFKLSTLTTLQSARAFTINAGFDTNGDIFPFPDRVGTIGRNTYKGDPYYDVDMRLQRLFSITERVKLEGSAEVFNLVNRVNVQDVNHAYGAPDFIGPVPRFYGDGIHTPAGFGTPKFVDPARQFQLSARVNF